ncbi:MFS transporter [Pontibacter sp. G13]|uniref:MFS transporter n=1 Tax=Pontibacter sp. G13 TaxID=3074898 RepID=UPI00288AA3CD|nr:MFS transporter [Pontibacter sp. G13]WNJ17858.1 MFS transporter [Pontibacter sp. G13]
MKFRGRYLVVAGMFLLSLLLYIDRICISVAKDSIGGDLALDDKTMGWVLSAFALGYALFQVPSGWMSDRFGPRKVLAGIVTFWSGMTAMTGTAWNFASIGIMRFLFGAGEAGAFPGMSRAIYSWIPLRERGLVLGLNFSGSRLGAAFALPLVAYLLTSFGWRNTFMVLGAVGIGWAILWYLAFRDTPEEQVGLSDEERKEIIEGRQIPTSEGSEVLSLSTMLQSRNMWSAIGQYFCSNFTFFFALTWLFPHLKETYQLETLEAGWYATAPFVAGAIGNWIAGLWVDRTFAKGFWNRSRQLPAMVGFALAAAGLLGSLMMETPLGAVLMLSIAVMGADMTLPPSWALCVDIGQKNAGAVSGTMNMAGNIGSFLTALAFPYLTAWTGSVDFFFYTAAGLNVLAILLWWRVQAKAGLAH